MVVTIVVIYNGMRFDWINKCFNSILNSSINSTIIAIDNNSSDDSVSFVKRYFPQVILIESDRNLGFGGANNIGLQRGLEIGAEYFFLLNQDATVDLDTIEILMHKANKFGYGLLSPMQYNSTGEKLDRNFKSLMNEKNCKGIFEDLFFDKLKEIYDIKFVMAAFWLITKSTLLKIGYFNPTFNHYGEDDDYLNRVHYHNIQVGLVPSAKGFHDREFRSLTTSQIIYLKYTTYLVELNDLNKSTIKSLFKVIAIFIYSLISNLILGKFEIVKLEIIYFYKNILKRLYNSLKYKKKFKRVNSPI